MRGRILCVPVFIVIGALLQCINSGASVYFPQGTDNRVRQLIRMKTVLTMQTIRVFGNLFCIILVVFLAGCSNQLGDALSVTGQIEGVTVEVGSLIGGRVSEVLVDEGAAVNPGDVLLRLESFEADAQVAGARASLAQAEAALAKLEAGARAEQIRQVEAALAQAEQSYQMALKGARSREIGKARASAEAARASRDEAEVEYKRIHQLYEEDVASKQMADQTMHALEAAQGVYEAALESLNLLVEGTRGEQIAIAKGARDQAQATLDELQNGARVEDIDAARAFRDAAKAALERADVRLREMTIISPMAGVIDSIDIHPGDIVTPGAIVSIADPEDLELMIYVGAAALGRLRLGQEVAMTTDSHGAKQFAGTIVHIAQGGEFTPRNLQTQEERVQQVFGVKIALNSAGGELRAGMAATVHLDLVPD